MEASKEEVSHDGLAAEAGVDELQVQCPPHTTEKKLMARIDWHILPFVIILYLLAFLDRVNVAVSTLQNTIMSQGNDV